MIAALFLGLAVYVVIASLRAFSGAHPGASWVGIGLAAVTAPTMPLLARAKRRVGHQLGSRATVSESSQNMLCAYLSVTLLAGLGANALLGWWWADPLAGLVIAAAAVQEGRAAWRGEACGDDCC
jgi:divalent metal cation (Fe/Co/Zn/Cd) transporter